MAIALNDTQIAKICSLANDGGNAVSRACRLG